MTKLIAGESQRKTARVAGFLYLIVAVTGGFANFFARVNLIVPGDAAATVENIRASESLFRLGLVGDLIAQTVFCCCCSLYTNCSSRLTKITRC